MILRAFAHKLRLIIAAAKGAPILCAYMTDGRTRKMKNAMTLELQTINKPSIGAQSMRMRH